MTEVIVYEPHLDDAVLFASWRVLQYHAKVVSVLADSRLQDWLGVTSEMRLQESRGAMAALGVESWDAWDIRDDEPDWDEVRRRMALDRDAHAGSFLPLLVYVPAIEAGGNEQHSAVARAALAVYGEGKVRFYCTYTGAPGVKTRAREVPFEQAWLEAKHRALACYRSQINVKSGAYRFFVEDLREYEP